MEYYWISGDTVRLNDKNMFTWSDSSVSPGYYKNYSVQPSPSIVQLYVLRKLLLDYVKVSIKY